MAKDTRNTRRSSSKKQPSKTRSSGRQLPQPAPRQRKEKSTSRGRKTAPADPAHLSPGAAATAAILGTADAELPAAPDLPPVINLALRDIDPNNPYQTRRFNVSDDKNPDIVELAESIRAKGVLVPIIVRLLDDGQHRLLAGEQRYRASCLQMPHLDEIGAAPLFIPAVVLRDISDTDAAAITITENLKRRNLKPFEEVEAVATLLGLHGGDPARVARELGQPATWVACRARVHTHLTEAWKEAILKPESRFWTWSIEHFEQIAKLAPQVQEDLLQHYQGQFTEPHVKISALRSRIAQLTLALGRAPFDTQDDTLVPTAGACTTCPDNTLAQPLLFSDQHEDPQGDIGKALCLNRNCFLGKCQRASERMESALRQQHPTLTLIRTAYTQNEQAQAALPPSWRQPGAVLSPHQFEKVTKKTEGAQPALVIEGPGAGKLVWITPARPDEETPSRRRATGGPAAANPATAKSSSTDSTLTEERRAKFANRRISRMVEHTHKLVSVFDGSTLSSIDLLALSRIFGTSRNSRLFGDTSALSTPWPHFQSLRTQPLRLAAHTLWKHQLLPVLLFRLQYNGPEDYRRLVSEIRGALNLIDHDVDELYRQVAAELPQPKSWAKLTGYVPEDLATLTFPQPTGADANPPTLSWAIDTNVTSGDDDTTPFATCGEDELLLAGEEEVLLEDRSFNPPGPSHLETEPLPAN